MKSRKLTKLVLLAILFSCMVIMIYSCGGSRGPQSIGNHAMAYDSESKKLILFGGQLNNYDTTQLLNWTWAYDSETEKWEKLEPETRPPKVYSAAMAYDIESDRVVLFLGDTWTYDYNTTTWELRTPAVQPPSFAGAKAAYDGESDRVILFGGTLSGETWAYDENSDTWEKMSPKQHPSMREYHAMTYDTAGDRIILFGGGSSFTDGTYYKEVYSDTWLYDYNSDTWKQSDTSENPLKRVYHQLSYCEAVGKSILYGGLSYDGKNTVKNEIWTYDSGEDSWAKLPPQSNLKPRRKHTMVSLPGTSSVVMIGGICAPSKPPSAPRFTNDVVAIDIAAMSGN